ncbi:MAG: class I SAM-dependent methyltransferase [Halioglobus sp.]|nr:class I SAM-dependent methyltransferase [Halioglobus sp.]
MQDFTYKDNEASMPALSAMLTSRMGDGSGNHEAAHLDTVRLLMAALADGSLLDVGCGQGRFTAAGAALMREVVALEPDPARCNWTRELVADRENTTVLNLLATEFIEQHPGRQFDLVILSMVIQHLATDSVPQLLADVARLTTPGGMAVVSTTHALEKARCFFLQHAPEQHIGEAAFNDYARDNQSLDMGLPVRRFSRSEFIALIPDAFEIVLWNQFSYYRPEQLGHFARLHRVAPDELSDVGNSQYLVLKKRAALAA